jgi:hypothetical protein
MGPAAQAERHDAPGLVDQLVPGEAAVIEDVGVGGEDPVRQPVVAHELPDVLDRPFDGLRRALSSGDLGGRGKRVMLSGTTRLRAPCHPA